MPRKEDFLEGIAISGLQLFAALLLVALNGLFVAAEFAFVKIRTSKVEEMVREGKASAGIVKEAIEHLDGYLAVCQLGITIASLGLGALGEPAIATLIEPLLEPLGVSEGTLHVVAFVVGFGIITFLHVVFGELAAKSFAIAKPEGTSQLVAPFMKFFYYAFRPGVWLFNGTANTFVRMFGVPPASEGEEAHSEEELRLIIGQSTEQGILKEDEEGMLRAVIQLEETRAREIMVPRPNVESLPAEMRLEELFSVVAEGNHTRYPLFEEDSVDHQIVGMIHAKDVLRAAKDAGDLEAAVTARDLMRDVLTIPENKSVDEILKDLRAQGLQMAVVIDEWGSFEGLLTIEDIVEEIVGEISDEFDEERIGIQEHDGGYLIDGRLPIRDVNEGLGSGFESKDFDTIGGLILGHLGRAPEVGDEIILDDHVFRVNEVDGTRVASLMVREERSQ
jgi:CBS domain containing-hemolysin-like protein